MLATMAGSVKRKRQKDTGRAIRVRQEVYIKLVRYQMVVLTQTGTRPTIADLVADAVKLLVDR